MTQQATARKSIKQKNTQRKPNKRPKLGDGAQTRASNRHAQLLDVAAELFATTGFRGTTMRDIAARTKMLPGSIYYHFPSKDQLLVAVYEEGVKRLMARIDEADPGVSSEPWLRLEAILTAHLQSILDDSPYARVLIRVLPDVTPTVSERLIELRDSYEQVIADIIAELPLAPGFDQRLLRLFLIGAANHVHIWRREGQHSPEKIAVELVRMFRLPVGAEEGRFEQ